MKSLFIAFTLISFFSFAQTSNAVKDPVPKIQDLDFLVGTWDITFEIYDTHYPDKGVLFTEKGRQVCFYELPNNGEPRFITCKGEVISSKGRVRTFSESIRYSRFSQSFERTGIFSNWPATSNEILTYDSALRKMVIAGELGVENNMLERYEDIYCFSSDLSAYTRKNVANFSDMPITQFKLTLTGSGTKVE